MFVFHVFLVTNVCNQGKTLCSPCSYFSNCRPFTYFQSGYTRCCINTTVLLRMSTQLLETCRGFK